MLFKNFFLKARNKLNRRLAGGEQHGEGCTRSPDNLERYHLVMNIRGKILRDTNAGPGLLSIALQQVPFTLEQHWKSDVPPKVGAVVDVERDAAGAVLTVVPVAEVQLAREQAEQAMLVARAKGGALAAGLTARFGLPTLIAMTALLVGWFFLNSVWVQMSQQYGVGMSFWKILGVINTPGGLMTGLGVADGSAGLYGFFCLVAFAAPLAAYFWNDRRAHLGGLLPLLFMVLVGWMIYKGVSDGMKHAQGVAGMLGSAEAGRMMENMGSEMLSAALRSISMGAGVYVAVLASLFLAARGLIKFLASKA